MPAAHFGDETRGLVLMQFHIGDQRGPGITTLHQVVTQDQILREAPGGGLLKGVHIVNALADVRPLGKQILIHVGYLPRVGINACVTGKQPDKPGAAGTR